VRFSAALAALVLLSGCAGLPQGPVGPAGAPLGRPVSRPGSAVPASSSAPVPTGVSRSWLVTEEWNPQSALWAQEWALRWWHTYRADRTSLDLNPEQPLPPLPPATAVDEGGEPRVWRIDWKAPSSPAPAGATVREITFPASDTNGLPPSLHALKVLLTRGLPASGAVRVVSSEWTDGRFHLRLEFR
jgi:hypothetical protein